LVTAVLYNVDALSVRGSGEILKIHFWSNTKWQTPRILQML